MKIRLSLAVALAASCLVAHSLSAQELGPHFKKIKDGIYVQTSKPSLPASSNGAIIVTSEGVLLVDTGQTAIDSRELAEAVKKLTSQPVRFIVDTETHPDHSYGHFLFSPPAVVINHEGAGAEMKESFNPKRNADLEAQSPEMKAALQGFKLVPPQVEYGGEKVTINLGERTFVLMNLGTTHSLANTAVWLPKERVLFAASVAVEDQINTIRPHTNIPDMIRVMKTMKDLNAEVVIPGHGVPTTNKIFDFYSGYLTLLVQRVGELASQGKSLDEIKTTVKLPEYDKYPLGTKETAATNVEAAYRAVQAGYKP